MSFDLLALTYYTFANEIKNVENEKKWPMEYAQCFVNKRQRSKASIIIVPYMTVSKAKIGTINMSISKIFTIIPLKHNEQSQCLI